MEDGTLKQKIIEIIDKIRRRILMWRVERALGIELFDWQIAKIFDDTPFPDYVQRGRRQGKTTAQILFVLLCPKLKHSPSIVCAYGFPPKLYADKPPTLGHMEGYEAARIAFFFGEDGVCVQRRYFFIEEMRSIAEQLHAAKIKTHRVTFVYRGRTHHI